MARQHKPVLGDGTMKLLLSGFTALRCVPTSDPADLEAMQRLVAGGAPAFAELWIAHARQLEQFGLRHRIPRGADGLYLAERCARSLRSTAA
jgi:hypothetical protein